MVAAGVGRPLCSLWPDGRLLLAAGLWEPACAEGGGGEAREEGVTAMSKMGVSKAAAVAVVVSVGLSACVTDGMGTKQMVGTGVGGAGGGAVGWFAGKALGGTTGGVIGAIVGTLGGAFVGSEIGSSLDKADQAALQSTANQALNQQALNQPVVWQNPQNGNVVETTVVRDVYEPQPQQPRSKRKAKAAVA